MNTAHLKKFAQGARRKLLSQVGAKLDYVLTHDTAELREQATAIKKLKTEIQRIGKDQVVEKVSYVWFNRLMALRFMDANDYQPSGIRILSARDGESVPEILQEAKSGALLGNEEWAAARIQKISDLLDGKLPSQNPQNEAYRLLLVGACNQLSNQFPFLFERINDYAELLLPDDLTSEFSVVYDVVEGMSTEDCKEVEIIGWLYQFYISEKNEELISSKKVYKKEDLAPASQLFTPKWIVQYMVDNTLGQVWSEINPSTKVTADLEFYIKPAYLEQLEQRDKKSIEDIKFFEPCTGSGHILAYAFDVFFKIYEEEGYNPTEISELIITKNLYGVDIDQRAAQLASFVLLMKGRQKNRRFLKAVETKNIQPNISFYQDFEFDDKFKNATALGSLIKVEPSELKDIKIDGNSLFGERQQELKKLYQLLGQRYDVVVTNPPYIHSSRMEGSLKQYVETIYPETKSDLFATFILKCLELCNDDGLTGYMTPFNWMFLSSFEELRKILISNHTINNLIQLHKSGFDGATVFICTFTLRKNLIKTAIGNYIRLSDFPNPKNQSPKTLEAIRNPTCGWFYSCVQNDFSKIIGSPIGYWVTSNFIRKIADKKLIEDLGFLGKGLDTGNNECFLRLWYEIGDKPKWKTCIKGGMFRKWYGNIFYVIDWENEGNKIKEYNGSNIRNSKYYFQEGLSWSRISSGKAAFRYLNEGSVFEGNGPSGFFKEGLHNILALLNSKVVYKFLEIVSPTLTFQSGEINKISVVDDLLEDSRIELVTKECIKISKLDWDFRETSSDFMVNNLIQIKSQDLEESYELFKHYWHNKFLQLHKNEEELNQTIIEIYGLQDELTPDVPLEDITILKEETVIENGDLVFKAKEVFGQFISYAVGCMFGRYSLDKEGLILANQGETLEDYLAKVGTSTPVSDQFVPDDDNIIPVLDDEWFEDDIVGRFHAFLKASFGERDFAKNLQYLERQMGKDIRKYFVNDFYDSHIKRYKKRPIYWMFSSPKGHFRVLVYIHRYTTDTLSNILNSYLRDFIQKLQAQKKHYQQLQETGSAAEQTKAIKQIDKLDKMLHDCQEYEREILYPLATERISIDLDDGVLVNYNKFGKAVELVAGLNDKATKKKVRDFDWIDVKSIKD